MGRTGFSDPAGSGVGARMGGLYGVVAKGCRGEIGTEIGRRVVDAAGTTRLWKCQSGSGNDGNAGTSGDERKFGQACWRRVNRGGGRWW